MSVSPRVDGPAQGTAEAPPELLLPSSQAWGVRVAALGVVLVMLGFAIGDMRNPERFFAEKMMATGDIHVMATSDAPAEAAFARALGTPPEEARMTLVKSDWQARSYQVLLAAPNRDLALAQLEALLERFRREFSRDSGPEAQAFASSYVAPLQTPKVRAWARRIRLLVLSLIVVGVAATAGGVWMLWVAVKGDKRKFSGLLYDDDDESGPGDQPLNTGTSNSASKSAP